VALACMLSVWKSVGLRVDPPPSCLTLHDYNFHRPHSALNSLPPSSRLPKTADNVSRYNS